MVRETLFSSALFGLLAAAAPGSPTDDVRGTARLLAPEASVVVLNAAVTLPVVALPVAPGEPVSKGTVLVELKLEKIERELRQRQKDLRAIQEEKRYRTSNREVQRGGGTRQFEGPSGGVEVNLAIKEADAMRDMLEVQTKLSIAEPRASEDGYLVRNFYAAGAEAKRRKPLVSFVAATRTALTVTVAEGVAADFPPGAAVAVTSAADSAQRFRATVVSAAASTGSDGVELTLRPLELPFLALDRPATVTVVPDP